STPVEVLCKNFANEFATFLNYCRALRFDDKPDYAYLRRLFRDLFFRQGYAADYRFDWTVLNYQKHEQAAEKERSSRNVKETTTKAIATEQNAEEDQNDQSGDREKQRSYRQQPTSSRNKDRSKSGGNCRTILETAIQKINKKIIHFVVSNEIFCFVTDQQCLLKHFNTYEHAFITTSTINITTKDINIIHNT
ncbi:hypothetical protein RFI_30274, partial [Reticulomyxa filosa]